MLVKFQKKVQKVTMLWDRLIIPSVNIIISLFLILATVYLYLGGSFDISSLADENNTVHIPMILLIVLLPVGYLIDFVGVTLGLIIVTLVLCIWLTLSVSAFVKRVKELNK